MKTHKNPIFAALLIILHVSGGLWAQEMVENEAEMNYQSYLPMDAELYQPESTPEPSGAMELMVNAPAGRCVIHDMLTREDTFLDLSVEDPPSEEWTPGSKIDEPQIPEDQFDLMNFSDLTWIPNPEDWPWCPTCKIYYTRRGIGYTATGFLIDAYHVLCAGHSLNEGNGGIWSSDIVVVPAYNGGICPYGDAKSVLSISWEGWTVFGDLNHDIGIIRLNRPIGALTGWYGYGYSRDLSFYLRAYFQNPGYPAESPYTGEFMYSRGGTFDSMEYPQAIINRKSFRGQAGSGAWAIVNGSRNVYAVLSSWNNTRSYFPIITEHKYAQIKDTIDEITPLKFDLISLDVKVSPGIVWSGEQLDSMTFDVYNHSSSSWCGTASVDVYLSTNSYISISDTLIGRYYLSSCFEPKEKRDVTIPDPPTIPWSIPRGDYWIGVIMDIPDNDRSNNHSHGQDAAQIAVF